MIERRPLEPNVPGLNPGTPAIKGNKVRKIIWKQFDPGITRIKTGMLLKIKDSEGFIKINLVGDVNRNLGVCNDCTNYDEDEIFEYSTNYLKDFDKLTGCFNSTLDVKLPRDVA